MVCDLCIKFWLYVSAAVGDSRIGAVKFDVLDTSCESAEREGEVVVGVVLAVDCFAVDNCRDSHVLEVINTELRSDLLECFDCDNIHGVLNADAERGESAVSFAVPVADRCAVVI